MEGDIGRLLELNIRLQDLSREEKYSVLTKEPYRDSSSCYPRIPRHLAQEDFVNFNQTAWLSQDPWIHYSRYLDGVYCRACVFFSPTKFGGQ